jgi:hypothetical protein
LGLKGAEREWSSQRGCVVSCVRHEEIASKVRLIKARLGSCKEKLIYYRAVFQ